MLKEKIFFLLLLTFTLNAKNINLVTGEWFPYSTSTNSFKGLITEIVEETFKNNNTKTNLSFENFDIAYKKTLKNEYEGAYPFFKTKQRNKEMLYSEALFEVENVLFYNKDLFNKKEMNKLKIGTVNGYAYKNINIKEFTNTKIIENELVAFDMLNKGNITLLPANKLVGIHIVKKYFNDFYSNIGILEDKKYISTNTLHLVFKKNERNVKVLNDFNNSLKKLKRSGKYKEIILKNKNLIQANLSNVIKLVNNTESFPMVVAQKTKNSEKKYIIPRGTKAIVLEWSKHFKEEGQIKVYDEMFKKTKVKIINGPLKGKILYVENMYIEID